ncbi:DUF362 domain-containing protein [Natranaerobius trueperi]|uniref:(Fe-S)-binding protein n=1 Tax=Natranaerobius trueperi TaxID=759412 RepID=A0A226BUN0_9FIRM|nr:DUF362 domain-containing protein [Natranaerobius trueperi]OWZ82675.1 (Fe-S)-binding protein [Natranaerobius trueperi]
MSINKAKVSICGNIFDYNLKIVRSGLEEVLDYIGGLSNYINTGDTVLLKVNMLSPKKPVEAVTTHPNIVQVMCEMIRELGAYPVVGDSSGGVTTKGSRTKHAFKLTEIEKATQRGGGTILNFDEVGAVKVATENFNEIYIAKSIYEADIIISLPKFKTHGLTYFTGAIKNMYGVIPGTKKREYHRLYPDVWEFSKLLADLYWETKPDLNIMDGIWAMEGNGPSAGKRKDLGLLLASDDGVALDEIASHIIGFKPKQVKAIKIAHENGYGQGDINNIELNKTVNKFKPDNFKHPSTSYVEMVPSGLIRTLMGQLGTIPEINQSKCSKCGLCHQNCPVDAIEISKQGQFKVKGQACIECLCCHELCPIHAVKLSSKGVLGRIYSKFKRT